MSLSSDEINLLIQHYLQEFGYDHAAFAFGVESKIPLKPKIASRYVPPGSLVYLIQKGILLSQIEKHADESVSSPACNVNSEIAAIRQSMHQSSEMNRETMTATRVLRLKQNLEQGETAPFYNLTTHCALFLEGHNKPVVFAKWSDRSEFLATASADGMVIVWRFDTVNSYVFDNPVVLRPGGTPPDITTLDWSLPDKNGDYMLAVGTFVGDVVVYKDKTEVFRLKEHRSPIIAVKFARVLDGEDNVVSLASVSTDGLVVFSENGMVKNKWNVDPQVSDLCWYNEKSFYVSSNKSVFSITCDSNNTDSIYEMPGEIVQITLSQSNKYLAIGDDKGDFVIVGPNKKVVSQHNHLHDLSICSISASSTIPENDSLYDSFVIGGCDGFIKIMTVGQEDPINFDGHARAAYLVSYDPQNRYIASVGADKTISVWSIASNSILFKFLTNIPVDYLVWSTNGNYLVVCLHSGQVSLIDFASLAD